MRIAELGLLRQDQCLVRPGGGAMQQVSSCVRVSGAVPFDAAGMEVHVLLSPQDLFPFADAGVDGLVDGPIEPGRLFESYEAQVEAFLSGGWRWVDDDPRCVSRAISDLSDIQAIVEENGKFMLFGCPLHVAVVGSDGARQVAGGTLAGSGTFDDLLPPRVLPTLVDSTASLEQYIVNGEAGLRHVVAGEVRELGRCHGQDALPHEGRRSTLHELDRLAERIAHGHMSVPSEVSIDSGGNACGEAVFVTPLRACAWAGFVSELEGRVPFPVPTGGLAARYVAIGTELVDALLPYRWRRE